MDNMSFEKWLQSSLTTHGFPCGVIDGKIGRITMAALAAFQAANRLPLTGVADPITVEALRGPASAPDVVRPNPGAASVAWPRQADVGAFYGQVGTSQGKLALPFPMRLAWDPSVLITRITLHEKVVESAGRAFEAIASAYSPAQRTDLGIDLFGGSLNVRKMRGGSEWSMHSWGIAIDFDPIRNQLTWKRNGRTTSGAACPVPRLSMPDAEAFWEAWEAEGWVSLGQARDFDWMHVQAARL